MDGGARVNEATAGTLAVTLVGWAEILLGIGCIIIGAALAVLLRPPSDSRLRLALGLGCLVLVLLGVLQLLPHATELLGPVGIGLSRLLTLLAGAIAALAAVLAALTAALTAARALPAALAGRDRARRACSVCNPALHQEQDAEQDAEHDAQHDPAPDLPADPALDAPPTNTPERAPAAPLAAASEATVRGWTHELNNLLTMIAGHGYLLRRSLVDETRSDGSSGSTTSDGTARNASLNSIDEALRRAEALCARMGARPAAATADAPADGAAERRADRQPKCVLILDDEPELLHLAAAYFARLGIETLTTTDPDKAIELLRTAGSRIEAVIVDYLMPLRRGDEVLREMLQFSAVDAYLTSGFSRVEIGDSELDSQLAGFIAKPFRFEDFAARFGAG